MAYSDQGTPSPKNFKVKAQTVDFQTAVKSLLSKSDTSVDLPLESLDLQINVPDVITLLVKKHFNVSIPF
jgi:hypothetical protein